MPADICIKCKGAVMWGRIPGGGIIYLHVESGTTEHDEGYDPSSEFSEVT